MIKASRIASGLADDLPKIASPATNPKPRIEDAFRRGVRLGLSIRAAFRGCPTCALLYEKEARVGHADRSSRSMLLKAQADRFAVDLILDCERAASRRNPRDCDPTRWSRTAWRRYLYAAAHAPSLVDPEHVFGRRCAYTRMRPP